MRSLKILDRSPAENAKLMTSLHRDFMPSAWGMYAGTRWDWATFVGSIGLFLALLFLFLRFLPMISIFEMRELVSETTGQSGPEA